MTETTWCVIPAKANSERLPGKNMLEIGGKPLIQHTIEACLEVPYFDKVVVYTDSDDIAVVAIDSGAVYMNRNTPHKYETEGECLNTFLDRFGGTPSDNIALVYPTTPFKKVDTLVRATNKFLERDKYIYHSLRTLRKTQVHPFKQWRVMNGMCFTQQENEFAGKASQVLKPFYQQVPLIYITTVKGLHDTGTLTAPTTIPYVISDEVECFDINTPLDFKIAKYLMEDRK